jgi:hypothetical protein
MPMFKRGCVVLLLISASACGGSPPAPSTPTRIIGLSGNLAFGNVKVGQQSAPTTLTITNSGNSTLTVTGITVPNGAGTSYTASFTNGTISAFGSQQVTITFAPKAAQSYNGALTVNGDQTSGTNTIAISGTGLAVPLTAEEFCATLPNGAGTGHPFYCGTSQANLQHNQFPDGSLGFCDIAQTNNLGLVGYAAYGFNGIISTVDTQSNASTYCNAFNVAAPGNCPGYIMCTRQ